MANDKNLQSLYNTLKKEGYNPPEFSQFAKDMRNESNLQRVHDTLLKEGYTPPEFSRFKTDILGTPNPTPAAARRTQRPAPALAAYSTQEQRPPSAPTAARQTEAPAAGQSAPEQKKASAPVSGPAGERQRVDAAYRRWKGGVGRQLGAFHREGEQRQEAVKATGEAVMSDPFGEKSLQLPKTERRMEAQERSAERWAQSADRADRLAARDLVEQKQEIEAKIRELEEGNALSKAAGVSKKVIPGGALSMVLDIADRASNKEIGKWRAALAQVDEALKQRRAALGHREDVEGGDGGFVQFVKGFGRGALDALTDVSLYDMGVSDLGNALALKDAAEKPEGERTEAERAALDAAALNTYVQGRHSDAGMGYTAGGTTVEAVPFMAEFAANPLSGAGRAGAKAAVRAAEKAMAKQMKNVVTRYVVKGAGRMAGDAVGAVGMAATTGAARVGADYARRRMGTAVPMVTEDGYIRFDGTEGGKGAGEAFGEALAAQSIENHSELLGNYFGPLLGGAGKAARKGLEKIGLGGVNRLMERMTASQAAGAVDGFMKRTQWHGTVGEYGEEVLGGIENALIVGDQTLDTDRDTGVFNLDRNIETFLAVASMTGFISAVKTGAYGAERHRIRQELREADARGAELFGDGWAEVRSALSFNGDGTASGGLRGILGSADYSEEQKRAALGYVAAGQKSRGAAVGEVKRRMEGELAPATAAVEDAYSAGRGMQTQTGRMEAAADMAEAEAALGTMDETDAAALKEGLQLNPAATLRKMIEDGATEEDVELARSYAEAMARFAGAQSSMADAVETERRRYAEELGRRTRKSDGMVVPAMDAEGREVYVVDGTVQTHDDGTIDTEESDRSVVVYDPLTKKRQKIASSALGTVGAAQEASALLAAEEERLRTEGERDRLWQFYGRLPLREGDRYEVMYEDGTVDTVTLTENHGDGTYTVQTGEGDSFIIDGATLQLLSDLRMDALMEERKRRRQEARKAYDDGRRLPEMRGDPEAQAKAQAEVDAIVQRMQEARGGIEDVFGAEAEARLYELDDGRGWDILDARGLTAEQQDAVLHYINSKAALDGVMDASNETADARRAEVERTVGLRTHKESGMIHPATMKVGDRRVYVVKGNVQMFPDGTAVDAGNSSKDIVVADGETGEYEFASPEAIQRVDEPVSPQEELQAALGAIEAERRSVFGDPVQERPDSVNGESSEGERDENGLPFVTSSDGTVDFGHVSGREGMKEAVPPVPAVGNGISGDAVEVRSASETGNSMSGNSPETTSGGKDTAERGTVQVSGEEAEEALRRIFDKGSDETMPDGIASVSEFMREFASPVRTVLGEVVKVGRNLYDKLIRRSRENISGAIRSTLEDADFVINDTDGSRLYVKLFKKSDGTRTYNVTVVNKRGEVEDYISSAHIKSDNNLLNKIRNGAGLSLPSKRNPYGEGSPNSPAPISGGKGSESGGGVQEPQPIGRNKWGDVYQWLPGRVQAAADFLIKKKGGYLKGVFHRDDIGDIDLAWGDAPTRYSGKGLAHILRKHVEALSDFPTVDDAVLTIEDVVEKGNAYDAGNNTWNIEKGNYRVVVAQDAQGNWILTAFDYKTPKKEKKGSVTPLTPNQTAEAGEAGAVASDLSGGKDTADGGDVQASGRISLNEDAIDAATPEELQREGITRYASDEVAEEHAEEGRQELRTRAAATARYKSGELSAHDYLASLGYATGEGSWLDSDRRQAADIAEEAEAEAARYAPYINEIPYDAVATDRQGNPVDADGRLLVERVGSVEELTDDDFMRPMRSVELPRIPENVDRAIGAEGKPVVIKRNIFEKNRNTHGDLTANDSREILRSALYSPILIGQTQPISRPHYWVAIRTADKNSVVVLEVNRTKDNVEIVGWRKVDAKGLEKMKRQAEREGGQFLIQTSEDAAAALSALPSDRSSGGEVTEKGGDVQASGRIPVDEKGNPVYEAAETPGLAWDAIVEAADGDEAMAQTVADGMVADMEAALKKAEKAKPRGGTTVEAKIAAEKARKGAIEDAKARLSVWRQIAGTAERRRQAAEAERRAAMEAERKAMQEAAHAAAMERLEAERRIKAEKAAEQERTGIHAVNPRIREKWDAAPKVEGHADAITLPDGSTIRGRYVLTEAGAATASHDADNAYAPTEGFPIDANGQSVNDRDYQRDKDAQRIVEDMADSYDNRALQTPVIVSRDGVVLSGNNRTMSGDLAAKRGTDKAYVEYLNEFAHKYGFTPGQVAGMGHPRVVFVADEALPYNATTFSRFNAQEMKSQSKPEAAVKLGKVVPDNVFNGIVGDISRYDRLSDFYADERAAARALGALFSAGVVNDKQLPGLRTGTALSAAGRELIENTLIGKVFQANPDAVREILAMPTLRQSVVMALGEIAANRTLSNRGYDLGEELADAADLVYRAKTEMPDVYTEGIPVSPFGRQQGLFDDEFGESRVTDAATLLLADTLNSGRPSDLRKVLASYNAQASASASGQLDVFTGEVESKNDILQRVTEHFKNATPKEQQALVDAAVAARTRRAEEAAAAGNGGGAAGGQAADAAERRGGRDAGGRALSPDLERGGQGDLRHPERRQQDHAPSQAVSKKVTANLSHETNEYGKPFVLAHDGTTTFGVMDSESGLPVAPIRLSLGENTKGADGMNHGYGLLHIEAGHGTQIRRAGYSSVEDFVEDVAKNYTDIREGAQIGERQTYLLEVADEHNNTLFVQLSKDGTYWNVNSAGIFKKKYSRRKPKVYSVPAVRESKDTDTSEVNSGHSKGATAPAGNSSQPSGGKGSEKSLDGKGLGEKIAEAEADTDTNPTDGQKEAGNYKKGHVQVGSFDITIEQPKGSVRSGVDADGNRWETEMKNTYGYIRGTEGVDGDHIDVFLSDGIDGWDGRRVFVADQYNTDGTFDEHKVMLGFNSEEEATGAYFANYEKDWGRKHRTVVSSVNLEDFEKWIDSSHRKTKPFAEYRSVKADAAQSKGGESAEAARQEKLSKKEAADIIAKMEERAEVAPEVELTPENRTALFGEDGRVDTPIGEVTMGQNQYFKLAQQGRDGKLGMIKPTLGSPDIVIEDERPSTTGESERETAYLFIKTFSKKDGGRYYHFTSVTVRKDGKEVVISNQERSANRISKLLQQGEVAWIDSAFSLHPTTQIEESVPLNDSNRPTSSDNQPALLGINSSEHSADKGSEKSAGGKGLKGKTAGIEGVEAAATVELTEEDSGNSASEPIAPYSSESSNFASRYETKEGKTIGYTSENPEAYGVSKAKDRTANSGAGEADVQRQGDNLLSGRNSGLNTDEGEFSLVERVFTENGSFNFTSGEKIESADDVAFIFSALEDAAKEHAFVVYVKDGHPTVVELGMGTFTTTMVDIPTASLAYNRIRPDQVYFVHNHPSGNLKCSMQDVQMLKKIEDMCDVPVSGVIINLKTGKYGTFDTSNNNGVGNKRVPDTESRLTVHTLDKQIFAPDYDPMAQPLVRGAWDVASFLNSHRMGDRAKVSFLILSRAGRIVGNIHTPFTEITSNTKEVARYISERVIKFGGESAILYGDFPMAGSNGRDYRQLKELLTQVGGNTLLDVVRVEGNHTTSASDEGLLHEPGSEYGSSQGGEEDARLQFAERRRRAVAEQGVVAPNLSEGTVEVVDVARHPFTGESPIRQAKEWAKAHLVGEHEGASVGRYTISNKAVEKYLSRSAAGRSENLGVHLSVLTRLPEVIDASVDAEVHPDYRKGTDGARRAENGVENENLLVHRLYGAVNIDGTTYRVKTTMHEFAPDVAEKNTPHSYEVTKIEVLKKPNTSVGAQDAALEYKVGPLGTAKLLEGVEKSYEKGKKLLEESGKTSEHPEAAVAEMAERVRELSEKLHTPVRIIGEAEEAARLPSRRQRLAKGWWSRRDNGVAVVLPNNIDVSDAENTVLHEVVGHYGLRAFIGEKEMPRFMDEIYSHAADPIKKEIDERAEKMRRQYIGEKGGGALGEAHYVTDNKAEEFRRDATEEYLADEAGRIGDRGFERMAAEERTFWGKVMGTVQRFLDKFLEGLGIPKSVRLKRKHLHYILYRSWKARREAGVLDEAEDIAMRRRTGYDGRSPSWAETCDALTDVSKEKSPNGNTSALSDSPSRAETPGLLPNHTRITDTKVRKVSDKLKSLSANLPDKGLGNNEIIFGLSSALGIEDASSGKSNYTKLNVASDIPTEIRISNHSGNTAYMGVADNNVGIVIKTSSQRFRADSATDYVEFMYYGDNVRGNAALQRAIVDGLRHYVETGSFGKMPEADRLNTSGAYRSAVESAGGGMMFHAIRRGYDGVQVSYRTDEVKDRVQQMFENAVAGNLKGKSISIGKLSEEGRAYLERLSGMPIKPIVDFVLNPSDLAHINRRHFGNNERDRRNIPLTIEDIRNITDVITHPDRIIHAKEKDGAQRNMFFFLKAADNGSYNMLEVYTDRRGNLTSKSFFKSKEGVSQRAMLLGESSALTSVTDGATLSNEGTKIPQMFENPNTEDDILLFRDGRSFTPRDTKIARDAYNRMVSSGGFQFKEAVQDSMLGLKKLYEAVLPGYRIEDVAGYENAYLFENRMSSTNAGEQYEYFVRYMRPLLTEIGRICGSSKSERRLLTDYLMAKHGLERNEYMRNEAASNGEATDRDFAGLTGLTGEAERRAAEAAAQTMVDDYEATHETLALWTAINAATKATLEKVYLSGMISEETWEKIRDMYEYYVPLRGWDQTTSDEVYGYLTSRNGPLNGSIMKKAHGRESMADDPIATIAMMADDAIRQGNRNCMKQRFLNFVLNHPSDAVSVHDLWLEYDAAHDEWKPVFADIEPADTAEEVARKVDAFEADMEQLRRSHPDRYRRGREAHSIPYKVVKGNLKEHQVLIKRNGRTFVATINGNPRAAQSLNGLTNPDAETDGVVGNLLKGAQWVNRQLSAFYTTRNPDFVVSNFFRDMLYSNCMTWVKESPRYALAFHKNFGRANPATLRRLIGKWEKGTLNRGNRLEDLFYQFMINGGETGYTSVKDIEGHKRAVAKELKRQGSIGRRAWSALGMQLDLLNRSAENCARFAAFVTSREFGRSIDRAIHDAKEVSVNFNKKGSGGKMVNAVGQTKLGKLGAYIGGGGRLAYVFWNAGIQGLTNAGRAAKRHPAKAVAGAGALFALGYVIPLLAQSMGGGGDDDDKNAYYNLPEYVRRSNICIRAGEQWISIPLPIEYRAIYGLGELACGVISGNERYGDEELAHQIGAQVSQIMPLDMLEGGGGISPLIPSAFKPFTEAYIMNRGWTGLPVYKDNAFNKNMPEWTKAYASADRHLAAFAKWLNETSGGDDFKKGAIDVNPAKIEYLLNGTFGGLFTFPEKVKKTAETAVGDRDFEWRNIPIANRLVKSGDERTAYRKLTNEYFRYYDEFEETGRLIRKYQNAADNGVLGYAEKVKFLETSPEYGRWEVFDFFKPDMDGYREDIKAETDAETRAQLEAEYHALMRELVNALHDPEKFWEGRKAQ